MTNDLRRITGNPVFFFRLVTKFFQPWWTVKLGTDLSIYMGVSINVSTPIAGWFIVENIIKMDDLGVPPFQETSIYIYIYIYIYYEGSRCCLDPLDRFIERIVSVSLIISEGGAEIS